MRILKRIFVSFILLDLVSIKKNMLDGFNLSNKWIESHMIVPSPVLCPLHLSERCSFSISSPAPCPALPPSSRLCCLQRE